MNDKTNILSIYRRCKTRHKPRGGINGISARKLPYTNRRGVGRVRKGDKTMKYIISLNANRPKSRLYCLYNYTTQTPLKYSLRKSILEKLKNRLENGEITDDDVIYSRGDYKKIYELIGEEMKQ